MNTGDGGVKTEAQLNQFLLEIATAQQPRIRKLVTWLTKAEERILDAIDLDNLTIEQYGNLAKSVSELQGVAYDLVKMVQTVANNKAPVGGESLEIEELSHKLASMNPLQIEQLKAAISQMNPLTQLTSAIEIPEVNKDES